MPIELRSPRKKLINIKNNDQNVFYGVMLDILILQKSMQEELKKLIKDLLVILTMMELSFLCKKKILARLTYKKIFILTCLVMKIIWSFRFLFLSKNLKIPWIYYFYLKTINHIMCTLKILTHLCFIKRKIKIKNAFLKIVDNVLVVKIF